MGVFSEQFGRDGEIKAASDAASEQSEKEEEVVSMVERLFQDARAARRPHDQNWKTDFEWYLGKQWLQKRPTYRNSEVVNLTYSSIQAQVPVLMGVKPRFVYLPEDPTDNLFAQFVDMIAEADWQRNHWSYPVQEAIIAGGVIGNGIWSMKFDPEANSGIGAIKFLHVDPFNFYPAPRAKDINDGSCPYVIEATPLPLHQAQAMFPKVAHKIKPDIQTDIPVDLASKLGTSRLSNTSTRLTGVIENIGPDQTAEEYTTRDAGEERDEEVLLLECYIQDETIEEVEIQMKDSSGNTLIDNKGKPKVTKETKKKFPRGRYIVVVGKALAFDGENPYLDGKHPYAKYDNNILFNEFWSVSDVSQQKSMQRVINRLWSFTMDSLTQMSNPIWVVDQGAVDAENLVNAPGLIVEKAPGSSVDRQPGVGLPPGLLSAYQLAIDNFDRIQGTNEVTQGVRPPGTSSGKEVELLQEAGQIRLRQKARNLEKGLEEIGSLYVSRVMQFYSERRFFTINQEGAPPKFFRFQVQEAPQKTGFFLARAMIVNPDTGQVQEKQVEQKFLTKGIFDVRVSVGSNLPFAKATREERAFQMFDRQIIDAEEVLNTIEWPNKEEVLKRLKERQEAAAQQPQQ